MLSSDEIDSSDEERQSGEEDIYTSDGSKSGNEISGQPSRDLTVEESDDTDESISIRRRKDGKRKKRQVVIDSEDEEEDMELENRALSPCTRMSITGIRPADLTDNSSEIEYSDEEEAHNDSKKGCAGGSKKSKAKLSNISEVYDSEDDNETQTENDEEEDREKSNVKKSFLEHSAESGLLSSTIASVQSELGETSNSSIAQLKSPSPSKAGHSNASIFNSPALTARYSTHFESAIKNKLSSTLHRAPEMDSSNDSDIQVIEGKEKPIVVSSSDSDDDRGISQQESQLNKSKSKTGILSSNNLMQPKISAALNKVPNLKHFSTPGAKIKAEIRYVSQEYYDKEVKKFEELKGELLNAEKLLEKISKSLPDGGRQLSLRIERLRADCVIKAKYIASMLVEAAPGSSPVIIEDDKDSPSQKLQTLKQQRKAILHQAPDWDELSAAVNQIKPKHTGKQGLATFNNQKVLTVDRLKVSWIFFA